MWVHYGNLHGDKRYLEVAFGVTGGLLLEKRDLKWGGVKKKLFRSS